MRRRIACIVIPALAASANAGLDYTTVNEPIYPGELNHAEILADVFGGEFIADGLDYSNGDITVTRVADDGVDGIIDLLIGNAAGPEDQFWSDGAGVNLMLEAKYAADSAAFGWIDGNAGGTFNALIDTDNIGESTQVALSDEFRWALNDDTTGVLVTSNPNDQELDGSPVDQMVSYHVTGLEGGANTWVLFFEDRIGGDYDYNDAVLQVTVVPTPGAVALLGMGGLLAARRRR